MRIMSYNEFLSMPEGTVYATNLSGSFSDLRIKEDIFPDGDWAYSELSAAQFIQGGFTDDSGDYFETLKDSEKNGTELKMDFSETYNNAATEALSEIDPSVYTYAVFNKDDVIAMIKLLFTAVGRD